MDLEQRIHRYKAIEKYRSRPLIVYATSTRRGVVALMAGDQVREFIDQLDTLPADCDRIDLLIHSTGGDALTAWKLMSTIRERIDSVSVLVPSMAFSAATLLCLGADEIVMHPNASLGPIDPQITIAKDGGQHKQFAYEDVGAFLRFLANDAQLQDQEFVSAALKLLFHDVDPVSLGAAKRASELSSEVGACLLSLHMEDEEKADHIATQLNKSFFAHSDAVSRNRAVELELAIADSDPELENLIWKAYLGFEEYMDFRTPFDPVAVVLNDPAARASLAPPAPLNLPPDVPQQVSQQILQGVANKAMAGGNAPEVPYETVAAIIESPRCASEFSTQGKLSASRQPNGEIRVLALNDRSSWRSAEMPSPQDGE